MNQELRNAIKLIEDNGGIVIMQELLDNPELNELIQREAEEKAELEKFQEARREQLKNLAEDFDEMLGSKNFSFEGVENLCHYHGCDLDDIEDLIHSYY
jgi:dephospho-CoA kinase